MEKEFVAIVPDDSSSKKMRPTTIFKYNNDVKKYIKWHIFNISYGRIFIPIVSGSRLYVITVDDGLLYMFDMDKKSIIDIKELPCPTTLNVYKGVVYVGDLRGNVYSSDKNGYLDINLGNQIFAISNYEDLLAISNISKIVIYNQSTKEIKTICTFDSKSIFCPTIQLMSRNFVVYSQKTRTHNHTSVCFGFIKEEQTFVYKEVDAHIGTNAFLVHGNEIAIMSSDATNITIYDLANDHKVIWSINAEEDELFGVIDSINSTHILCTTTYKGRKENLKISIDRLTNSRHLLYIYCEKYITSRECDAYKNE